MYTEAHSYQYFAIKTNYLKVTHHMSRIPCPILNFFHVKTSTCSDESYSSLDPLPFPSLPLPLFSLIIYSNIPKIINCERLGTRQLFPTKLWASLYRRQANALILPSLHSFPPASPFLNNQLQHHLYMFV